MRKQNTKTTVPLEVVAERRTEPFPPRFRPVGRFCELRFREGEISRPLDHMRQIPFIHSARLIARTNLYIYLTVILRGRAGYELIYVTNEAVGRVGYYQLMSGKSEKNNCFSKFSSNSLDFFA